MRSRRLRRGAALHRHRRELSRSRALRTFRVLPSAGRCVCRGWRRRVPSQRSLPAVRGVRRRGAALRGGARRRLRGVALLRTARAVHGRGRKMRGVGRGLPWPRRVPRAWTVRAPKGAVRRRNGRRLRPEPPLRKARRVPARRGSLRRARRPLTVSSHRGQGRRVEATRAPLRPWLARPPGAALVPSCEVPRLTAWLVLALLVGLSPAAQAEVTITPAARAAFKEGVALLRDRDGPGTPRPTRSSSSPTRSRLRPRSWATSACAR